MEKLPIQSYSKAELRDKYKVSREVFSRWIKGLEPLLSQYSPTSKVFTPAQVQIIFEQLGTPSEIEEDRKIVVKKR
jgi:Domain of unknown function (DUF4248)